MAPSLRLFAAAMVITMLSANANANQHRVGGMDAWALPTEGRSDLYTVWAARIPFKIGDSLLFLYPPSQDSVVQVTKEAYDKCDISAPILKMNDGNSLFNITSKGAFYFTSGQEGHCEKKQKFVALVGISAAEAEAEAETASASSSAAAFSPAGAPSPASALPTSGSSVLLVPFSALVALALFCVLSIIYRN